MSPAELPPDVRRFVIGAVASVPHLEAMLLLRAAPDADWTADVLSERLFVDAGRAAGLLADLVVLRLAAEPTPGHYRYAPRDDSVRATIDRLALHYSRHVVEVSRLIHAKLDQRAIDFSDAFRLRKDK